MIFLCICFSGGLILGFIKYKDFVAGIMCSMCGFLIGFLVLMIIKFFIGVDIPTTF